MTICQNCGHEGDNKYCAQCGEPLHIHRINLPHMLHEVAHTFWHLEKGFLYTLKELAIHPGSMQRNYISGKRLHYQKPFPLFAISTTICALSLYFIYRNAPNETTTSFYKHYYFIVQSAMLPFYAFITYILFKSPQLYYAEALVLNVYMLGFMAILILPLNLLAFFQPDGVISILEISCLLLYNLWTYLAFFKGKAVWWVALKSVVSIILCYLSFQFVSNEVMKLFVKH